MLGYSTRDMLVCCPVGFERGFSKVYVVRDPTIQRQVPDGNRVHLAHGLAVGAWRGFWQIDIKEDGRCR